MNGNLKYIYRAIFLSYRCRVESLDYEKWAKLYYGKLINEHINRSKAI